MTALDRMLHHGLHAEPDVFRVRAKTHQEPPSRGGRVRKKFIAAAYACGAERLRSQKQKDADQQTCRKCPEA
jgi:hypothetical protein